MKPKTLLINLVIIGAGLSLAPAQASDDMYEGAWGGLIKVKDSGKERRYRDDDEERRDRGENGIRSGETGYGNFGGYNSPTTPRSSRPLSFKERLNIKRQKEREEREKAEADDQQAR